MTFELHYEGIMNYLHEPLDYAFEFDAILNSYKFILIKDKLFIANQLYL